MFGYFLRAIAGAAAFMLTALVVGLGMIPPPEQVSDAAPAQADREDIPKDDRSLHILHMLPSSGLIMQQAADEFFADSGVAATVQTVASKDDYRAALRSRLASGEKTDLFQFAGLREASDIRPHLAELSRLTGAWLEDIMPQLLDSARMDGGVYGVPYSLEGAGIIVNLDIFEAAGIDPTQLNTLEAMEDAFRELHEKIVSGELSEPFPNLEAVTEFAAQDSEYLGNIAADFLLADSFENPGILVTSQTLTLPNSESFENLLVLFARFSTSRGQWPGLNAVTPDLLLENGIASGRVAAVLQSAEIYKRVNEVNPAMQGRLTLLPVPIDTLEFPVVSVGTPLYWAVRADEDGAGSPTALDFLNWLYGTEKGRGVLIDKFGALPPFLEPQSASHAVLHRQLLGYLRAGQTIPQIHNELDPRWTNEVFAEGVRRYFAERDVEWKQVDADLTAGWSIDEP